MARRHVYHLKIYSSSRFVIFFTLLMVSPLLILASFLKGLDSFFFIVFFIFVYVLSFFVALFVATAKVKVIFTEDAFLHIWEKKFLFSREKDIEIPWAIMDKYVLEIDRNSKDFIINLKTNIRYRIRKFTLISIQDDFDKMVRAFSRHANDYRKKHVSEEDTTLIKEGKTIYEEKYFEYGYYFFLFVFIVLLLVPAILDPEQDANWAKLAFWGSLFGFYGYMIRRHKKKKK